MRSTSHSTTLPSPEPTATSVPSGLTSIGVRAVQAGPERGGVGEHRRGQQRAARLDGRAGPPRRRPPCAWRRPGRPRPRRATPPRTAGTARRCSPGRASSRATTATHPGDERDGEQRRRARRRDRAAGGCVRRRSRSLACRNACSSGGEVGPPGSTSRAPRPAGRPGTGRPGPARRPASRPPPRRAVGAPADPAGPPPPTPAAAATRSAARRGTADTKSRSTVTSRAATRLSSTGTAAPRRGRALRRAMPPPSSRVTIRSSAARSARRSVLGQPVVDAVRGQRHRPVDAAGVLVSLERQPVAGTVVPGLAQRVGEPGQRAGVAAGADVGDQAVDETGLELQPGRLGGFGDHPRQLVDRERAEHVRRVQRRLQRRAAVMQCSTKSARTATTTRAGHALASATANASRSPASAALGEQLLGLVDRDDQWGRPCRRRPSGTARRTSRAARTAARPAGAGRSG